MCLICKNIFCKNCSIKVPRENSKIYKERFCTSCYSSKTNSEPIELPPDPSPRATFNELITSETFLTQKESIKIIKENPENVYKIGHKVGEGGQAIIYKAKKKSSGFEYAIKQIMIQNEYHKEKIIEEIVICNLSIHKNIIPIVETYDYNFSLWIVQELMVCNLKELVSEASQMSEQIIAYILHEVACGIAVLHNHGRIHRDIKSDNILISKDGTIKLADLGCAVQLVQEQHCRHTIIGTPAFMAPELVLGKDYNHKIDIWSFGILAIYLAEGEYPYANESILKMLSSIAMNDSPTLSNPGNWSNEFNEIVRLCLKKNPEERPEISDLLFHEFFARLPKDLNERFVEFLDASIGEGEN